MRCKFCHGQFSKCGRHLRNLRSWEKVIDNIDYHAKDYKKRRINFTGGEPLIVHYLDKLIKYAYDKNFNISLITNGVLLNKKFIEKIKTIYVRLV